MGQEFWGGCLPGRMLLDSYQNSNIYGHWIPLETNGFQTDFRPRGSIRERTSCNGFSIHFHEASVSAQVTAPYAAMRSKNPGPSSNDPFQRNGMIFPVASGARLWNR